MVGTLSILCFLCFLCCVCHAVPPIFGSAFGDYMVLQAGKSGSTLWGVAPSCEIEVTFLQHTIKPTSCDTGLLVPNATFPNRWLAILPPMNAGDTEYGITVADTSTNESSSLHHVLFGDVWVCSGQSNMAFLLENAFNGTLEVNNSVNYPLIRLFATEKKVSSSPQDQLGGVILPWSVASPQSTSMNRHGLGDDDWLYFSAVCWFFGKQLFERHGIPIGLIDTTWGGTPIEEWMSPKALDECKAYHNEKSLTAANSDIYNSMLRPLMNMTIAGFAWYQGEANAADSLRYNCTFPAAIRDWRDSWNQGTNHVTDPLFPFGFVQLSTDDSELLSFATLRWAQTASYGYVPNPAMPNTFMAVAMDLGDLHSPFSAVHPRHKAEVGARLDLAFAATNFVKDFPTSKRSQTQHALLPGVRRAVVHGSGPILETVGVFNQSALSVTFKGSPQLSEVVLRNNDTTLWEICLFEGSVEATHPCQLDSAPQNCALNVTTNWSPVLGVALIDQANQATLVLNTQHSVSKQNLCVRYAWQTAPPCENQNCAISD